MTTEDWMPPRWDAELLDCLWLPRMLDKGRRALAGRRQGRDVMNGYLFGDLDYADGRLLKFLRTNDARVLDLLSETEEDESVALTLVRESGRSPDEIRAWSQRFRVVNAPFLAMMDADEGRREPGLGTSLLKLFYNRVMMPPVYLGFRIGARLRSRRGKAPRPPRRLENS